MRRSAPQKGTRRLLSPASKSGKAQSLSLTQKQNHAPEYWHPCIHLGKAEGAVCEYVFQLNTSPHMNTMNTYFPCRLGPRVLLGAAARSRCASSIAFRLASLQASSLSKQSRAAEHTERDMHCLSPHARGPLLHAVAAQSASVGATHSRLSHATRGEAEVQLKRL